MRYDALLDMQPGTDLGRSDWHKVTQADIDAFAKLTRDEDPFHIDPEFARQHSPLGTTISFGFLTLSMLTSFSHQVLGRIGLTHDDDTQLFNLGFNRVRMPEPVPSGAEIRGAFTFRGARLREAGGLEFRFEVTVEIRGNDRPALVAEWLDVAVKSAG